MKKWCILFAILMIVLALAACSDKSGDATTEKKDETESLVSTDEKVSEIITESFSPVGTSETEETEISETSEIKPTEQTTTEPIEYKEVSMTSDIRYRANIFLSNFSELWFNEKYIWDEETETRIAAFEPFDCDHADPMTLLDFCWLHIKCNMYSEIRHITHESNLYYGIHIDTINSMCERFFGKTIERSEIKTGEKAQHIGYRRILIGDLVCTPAADGETYTNMTVANKMYELENGCYKVDFSIYTVNDIGGDESIVLASGTIQDKSVYYFSPDQAASHPDFSHHLDGTAIVRPYCTPNGTDTYQLVSYSLSAESSKEHNAEAPRESSAPTEAVPTEPSSSAIAVTITPQELVGNWNVDTQRTMDYNGKSMNFMFGKPYSDSMSFDASGNFKYYITYYGGEGSYLILDNYIEYAITDWYDEQVTAQLEVLEIDGALYLVQEVSGNKVFWEKAD